MNEKKEAQTTINKDRHERNTNYLKKTAKDGQERKTKINMKSKEVKECNK